MNPVFFAHGDEQAGEAGAGRTGRLAGIEALLSTLVLLHRHFQQRGGDVERGNFFALVEQALHAAHVFLEVALLHDFLDLIQEQRGFHFRYIGKRRHLLQFNLGLGEAHDVAQLIDVAAAHKREGFATLAGAARAADAVNVIFFVSGQVVVKYGFHVVHVDATGSYVGSNQHFDGRLAEFIERVLALLLAHVAVQAFGEIAFGLQVGHNFVHHALGVGENDARLQVVHVEDAGQHILFLGAAHLKVALLDVGYRHRLVVHLHYLRVALVLLGELHDGLAHRGREEHRLALLRHLAQNELDVVAEAHVEHFVGFIENDFGGVLQLQGATLDVVHDAAGCTDNNLNTTLQGAELTVVGAAAVNRHYHQAALVFAQLLNFARNLHRELAGGAEHQYLHVLALGIDIINGGNGESGGFAGTRLGLADNVFAGEQNGDSSSLNGRGFFVAHLGDGALYFLGEVQLVKTNYNFFSFHECGVDKGKKRLSSENSRTQRRFPSFYLVTIRREKTTKKLRGQCVSASLGLART